MFSFSKNKFNQHSQKMGVINFENTKIIYAVVIVIRCYKQYVNLTNEN